VSRPGNAQHPERSARGAVAELGAYLRAQLKGAVDEFHPACFNFGGQ
jgi:hypothetical protein